MSEIFYPIPLSKLMELNQQIRKLTSEVNYFHYAQREGITESYDGEWGDQVAQKRDELRVSVLKLYSFSKN